ncbi:hypothetical protein RvY_07350 [Ramazzottius varieornatus]|uniref:Uncharacterized protein n=1 Tax=Ramazzottius varieornatus TaxID=947166 RepID=A0A1D1V501_RAMVA|nr:hypothetical protein RvY_07350 [Ramazzottius varieornatus]
MRSFIPVQVSRWSLDRSFVDSPSHHDQLLLHAGSSDTDSRTDATVRRLESFGVFFVFHISEASMISIQGNTVKKERSIQSAKSSFVLPLYATS